MGDTGDQCSPSQDRSTRTPAEPTDVSASTIRPANPPRVLIANCDGPGVVWLTERSNAPPPLPGVMTVCAWAVAHRQAKATANSSRCILQSLLVMAYRWRSLPQAKPKAGVARIVPRLI